MAQAICNVSNVVTFPKSSSSSNTLLNGRFCCYPKAAVNGLTRLGGVNGNGVKAEKRDNLDHLQRPAAGLKRKQATSIPIGLWDRFPAARTVQQMMDTMDRMVVDPDAYRTRYPSQLPNEGNGYVKGRTPWEIKEVDTAYKLRFDMPGMTKEDVKIWVEEKMLVIKAEKVAKKKDGQENGGLVEDEEDWPAKSYGTYSSRIALPENVEFEKIKAEVRDGVLYLTIPKPSLKGKVFDINVE